MSLALRQRGGEKKKKEINKEQHGGPGAGCLNGGPDKGLHSSALARSAE